MLGDRAHILNFNKRTRKEGEREGERSGKLNTCRRFIYLDTYFFPPACLRAVAAPVAARGGHPQNGYLKQEGCEKGWRDAGQEGGKAAEKQ